MARRLNTKLLGISAGVIALVVVGLVVSKKFLVRTNPVALITQGDMFMAEKQYGQAAGFYNRALQIDNKDPALRVKLGDALNQQSNRDVEFVRHARAQWDRALELDPEYAPALKRLMQSYREELQLRPRAELFQNIRNICGKLIKIDPNDAEADGNLRIATIQQWLFGVETDPAAIDQSISGLSELMRKDPSNAQLPYFIAQAKVHRGNEFQRLNQQSEAARLFTEATAVFDDPLRLQNKNAMMYLLSAQVLNSLASVDRAPGAAEKYRSRCKAILDRGRAEIPATDPKHTDLQMAWASLVIQQGNPADAEKVYRDLLAQRPDDVNVRLALASLLSLDPTKRDEAIEILSAPVNTPSSVIGPQQVLVQNQLLLVKLQLTNFRLDAYASKKDDEERRKLLQEAETGYNELARELGDQRPEVMKLRGKMQLLQNQNIEAIQTLSRAMTGGVGGGSGQVAQKDYDMMFLLARAYANSKQTGQARALLTQILEKFPGSVQARMMIADLLVRENNLNDAKPHVDFLADRLPNSPDVIRLQLAYYNASTQKEEIRKLYAKLPESSRKERIDKAQVAINIKDIDDAIRLLENVRSPDGSEPQAMELLAKLYLATEKKEEAIEVAEEALAANPKNESLKMLVAMLKGAGPEEIAKMQRDNVANMADPLEREIAQAALAREQGKQDEALTHLLRAAEIKPDDKRVMENIFQQYVMLRRWDDAEKYLKVVTEANADLANGRLYRFRLLMAKQDLMKALDVSRELCRSLPEFSQSWLAQGQALEAINQFDDAQRKYEIALEKQNTNIDALRGMIRVSYSMGRPEIAKRYIDQARRAFPNDMAFRDLETDYELRFGDPERAVAPRLEQMRLNADQPNNWLQMGQTYFRVAQVRAAAGDTKAALEFLDKSRAIFGQAIDKFPDEPAFYGAQAEVYLHIDKFLDGEKTLKQLQNRPMWKDSVRPSLMLADLYQRTGKLPESEAAMRDALKKSNNDPDVQERLALVLSQQGKFEDALQVLDASSTDPRIRKKRMEVLMAAGRIAEAEKSLLDALDRAPNSPELLNLITALYIGTQRWDLAETRALQELKNDPQDTTAMYHMGLIRSQQPSPDPDGAIKYLLQVKAANPGLIDARYALAEAYRMKNDSDNAIRELESAKQNSPVNKTIRARLIELYIAAKPPRLGDADRLIEESISMPQFKSDPDFYRVRSFTALARGDSQTAITTSRHAVELSKGNPTFMRAFLDVLYQTKSYGVLEQQSSALIQQQGKIWWLYQFRALAKKNLGNKQGAMTDFQTALDTAIAAQDEDGAVALVRTVSTEMGNDDALRMIAPRAEKEVRYRLMAAQLYHLKGDYANSTKIVKSVLAGYESLPPKEQELALRFGAGIFVSAQPPQMDEALIAYQKLIDKLPNDYTALNNIACILAEKVSPPRPNDALAYSQRAYDLVQRAGRMEPTVYDTHGWVLTLAGRLEEGMVILQKVVDTRPIAESHYHLGEAYLRLKNAEQAKNQFQECMEKIVSAESNKQPIDPELKMKVERGLKAADDMMKGKSPRANVP